MQVTHTHNGKNALMVRETEVRSCMGSIQLICLYLYITRETNKTII